MVYKYYFLLTKQKHRTYLKISESYELLQKITPSFVCYPIIGTQSVKKD